MVKAGHTSLVVKIDKLHTGKPTPNAIYLIKHLAIRASKNEETSNDLMLDVRQHASNQHVKLLHN